MAVANLYLLHGIASSNPSFFVSQISSSRVVTDPQKVIAASAGMPWPQFVGTVGQKPAISFESGQVATILGQTGLLGVDMTAGQCVLYYKQAKQLATRQADASTVHQKILCEQAGLFWDRVTAGHRTPARISCAIKLPFDGTNAPMIPSGSVALSGTPQAAEQFVAGPVTINGVALPAIQEVTIESGIRFIEVGGDSDLYDTMIVVDEVPAKITLRTLLASALITYGLNGTALSSGSGGLVGYLKAAVNAAEYAANNVASHIKYTATIGDVFVTELAAGDNRPAMSEVTITLAGDATNAPLVFATGQTIT
jgi:hypothetical protein